MAFKLNDVVFISYYSSLIRGVVVKIMPSGRLVVEFTRDTGRKFQNKFNPDGAEYGAAGSFNRAYLTPSSKELEDLFQIQVREVKRRQRENKRREDEEREKLKRVSEAFKYAITALDGDTDERAEFFREIAQEFIKN